MSDDRSASTFEVDEVEGEGRRLPVVYVGGRSDPSVLEWPVGGSGYRKVDVYPERVVGVKPSNLGVWEAGEGGGGVLPPGFAAALDEQRLRLAVDPWPEVARPVRLSWLRVRLPAGLVLVFGFLSAVSIVLGLLGSAVSLVTAAVLLVVAVGVLVLAFLSVVRLVDHANGGG